VIAPSLLRRLVAVYARWLDDDELGMPVQLLPGELHDATVASVREFLGELIRAASGCDAVVELPASLKHPDSTFGRLLSASLVTKLGPPVPVEFLARQRLCVEVISRLLVVVPRIEDDRDNGMQASMFAVSGGEHPEDLARWVHEPANQAGLADALYQVLKSKLSHRTIRSFFTVDVTSNGYRRWNPEMRAREGAGKDLARHIVSTNAGDVSIEVLRYAVDEEVPVRAYEWRAELREATGSETPDAIACGMAYTFEREGGVALGGQGDLLTASDCMADVDLMQVNAFLEQHRDAQMLIEAGDLAFVWLWERRADSRPGVGAACLRAALADLRRRMRRIRTVVIDLKPYQFAVCDGAGMPGTLHIEKLEAVDRLQAFFTGLRLDKLLRVQCRFIVNREGDDPNATLRVLGYAGLAHLAARGLDDGAE